MRALRLLGTTALWLVAALGLGSVLVWGATQLGWVKPLVVVSGSMEPHIMTGDLLVTVPRPTSELRPGDVASLPSALTGDLVTHRVVAVEPADDGWAVRMKGDANATQDGTTYLVGDTVWQPRWQVAGGGLALVTLTRPAVAVPLGVALVALLGLSLLPSRPAPTRPAPSARPADRSPSSAVPGAEVPA